MQTDFRGFRRFPAVEKKIEDITPEDTRVSIIGTIIDKSEGSITIDDGTGTIEVTFNDTEALEPGKLVRVVGKIGGEGFVIGEAVQDFSNFNLGLYKELNTLEEK